jgi:DNA repair protein RecO (recombination protein O)
MEWTDEGIVLSARRHGEGAAIISLLTPEHGRYVGWVPGGAGRRARGIYEPGNRLQATWRARLSEQLGHYSCELLESRIADLLDSQTRLSALSAAVTLVDAALPEREVHRRVFDSLDDFIGRLRQAQTDSDWTPHYVRFELDLLADLGFGLDLSHCAATGARDDLVYVSPKTGRAVSAAAGAPYGERLLTLPQFLTGAAAQPAPADIAAGLRLTGYFLEQHVFGNQTHSGERAHRLPAARERLAARLRPGRT